jgi:uncharacterized membrane protein (UPF0136 family)
MTRARLDGLYLLLIGCAVFILLGAALETGAPAPMLDFRAVYYPARCLMQHCDPYQEAEVLRVYQAEGVYGSLDTAKERMMSTRYGYLPSAFSFTAPFALLPWGPASLLWITLTAASLIFASFLIWNLAANYAPIISGCLIGFLLANSEVLVIQGMCAGIVVSLCVVAVWCFLRERFIPAGILCLAVSLAVKPQDTGLVWLYLLLAGGILRKRAGQTLLVVIAMSLPMVLWVWHLSPHWMRELHSNILALGAHGGINDPSPASSGAHGLAAVISLQAVFSVFRDDPRVYNFISDLICAPLLLVWAFVTLRSRPTAERFWLGLAAVAALSMLPLYHRQYDAKLLLLTVPACAILWAEGGLIGRLAVLVNAAAFVLTGDLSWAIILGIISSLHLNTAGLAGQILTAVQVFPTPLILLVMSVFYLWVYVRRSSAHALLSPR